MELFDTARPNLALEICPWDKDTVLFAKRDAQGKVVARRIVRRGEVEWALKQEHLALPGEGP